MAAYWYGLFFSFALLLASPLGAEEAPQPLCSPLADCTAQAEAKLVEAYEAVRRELLQQACDQGDAPACGLAKLRRNQRRSNEASGAEEKKTAVAVFTQACETGNARACFLVGNLAREQKEWEAAKRLLAKSCDGNYWEGCMGLGGVLLELGLKQQAWPQYQKSCEQGIAIACEISDMLEKELN